MSRIETVNVFEEECIHHSVEKYIQNYYTTLCYTENYLLL